MTERSIRFEAQSELRRRRVGKNMSQEQLAALLNKHVRGPRSGRVTQATISTWETIDGRRPANFALRKALHRLLGVRAELWLTEDEVAELEHLAELQRVPAQA